MEGLTAKQRRFCEEYVYDWNATRAAKEAGYSENTAREMGCENLTKPHIKAYIEKIQNDLQKLAKFSALQAGKILIGIANDKNAKDADRINAISKLIDFLGLKGFEETKGEEGEGEQMPVVNIFLNSQGDKEQE